MAKVVAKLWPDTFVNHFQPNVGMAAVTALEDAGWRVEIPAGDLCCGLTWVSTGQLGVAKKVLSRTVARLARRPRRQAPWRTALPVWRNCRHNALVRRRG